MISCVNLDKRYRNGHQALRDIRFEVAARSMCFITGPSGAGKSTLLRLLAALERPSRGQLVVDGVNLSTIRSRHIPAFRRRLGIVLQDHQLLYDRSVYDNVALPLLVAGHSRKHVARRVQAALDKVGMRDYQHADPLPLSSGEQQRVGIARAVVHRPQLLLADEPTGNLDPALSQQIMAMLRQFQAVGVTVVIVSHDLPLIRHFDAPIWQLEQGRISCIVH